MSLFSSFTPPMHDDVNPGRILAEFLARHCSKQQNSNKLMYVPSSRRQLRWKNFHPYACLCESSTRGKNAPNKRGEKGGGRKKKKKRIQLYIYTPTTTTTLLLLLLLLYTTTITTAAIYPVPTQFMKWNYLLPLHLKLSIQLYIIYSSPAKAPYLYLSIDKYIQKVAGGAGAGTGDRNSLVAEYLLQFCACGLSFFDSFFFVVVVEKG